MRSDERKAAIRHILEQAERPISASVLAAQLGVSRQIIVGDIALLRAGGLDVSATPRGYVMKQAAPGILRQVACRHDTAGTHAELNVIVDHGCTVLDVIVEHPIYGQLTGPLQMSSRYDVEEFLRRCDRSDAKPLSDLTGGIHLHTLSCPDEAAFQRVLADLQKMGILLQN